MHPYGNSFYTSRELHGQECGTGWSPDPWVQVKPQPFLGSLLYSKLLSKTRTLPSYVNAMILWTTSLNMHTNFSARMSSFASSVKHRRPGFTRKETRRGTHVGEQPTDLFPFHNAPVLSLRPHQLGAAHSQETPSSRHAAFHSSS